MDIDISDICEDNHVYAIHLATIDNIISYDNFTYKIANNISQNSFKSVDFWRNISLSLEILLKACLLKHQVSFFKKRAHGEYGQKVIASKNTWLNEILKSLDIKYIAQINTGTISTTLKRAEGELFEKIKLNLQKRKLIIQMFYIIIRTRRNRNSHFFFPNQSYVNIAEVEMLFLPLLNLLESIYET